MLVLKNVVIPYFIAVVILGVIYSFSNETPAWSMVFILLAGLSCGIQILERRYRKIILQPRKTLSLKMFFIVLGVIIFMLFLGTVLIVAIGPLFPHSLWFRVSCYVCLAVLALWNEIFLVIKYKLPVVEYSRIFGRTSLFFYIVSILPRVIDTLSK